MPQVFLIGIPGILVISIAFNFIMIGIYSYTYKVLTAETLIAKIWFKEINLESNEHNAILFDQNGDQIGQYIIHGDQFQLDAKFMKMRYWSNILGLESRYGLERLQGRFSNIQDQNTKKTVSYDLSEDTVLDSFSVFGWNLFVDTDYGASTYTEIFHNYEYNIFKTTTGIIVRKEEIPVEADKNGEGFLDSIVKDTQNLLNIKSD